MIPPNFTRGKFRTEARPETVRVVGLDLAVVPFEEPDGAFGLKGFRVCKAVIAGCLVDVQVRVSVAVVNSKTIT